MKEAGANLEAQRAAAKQGGGAAGPAGSNKRAVPREVDARWGKEPAQEAGKPFAAAAPPAAKGKAAGARKGAAAAAGGKGKIPFWNEYEQEDDLLNRAGNSDQTGRFKAHALFSPEQDSEPYT